MQFTYADVYGLSPQDRAVEALARRFCGEPVSARIVGLDMGISGTAASKHLGHVKRFGWVEVNARGWVLTEKGLEEVGMKSDN